MGSSSCSRPSLPTAAPSMMLSIRPGYWYFTHSVSIFSRKSVPKDVERNICFLDNDTEKHIKLENT